MSKLNLYKSQKNTILFNFDGHRVLGPVIGPEAACDKFRSLSNDITLRNKLIKNVLRSFSII